MYRIKRSRPSNKRWGDALGQRSSEGAVAVEVHELMSVCEI